MYKNLKKIIGSTIMSIAVTLGIPSIVDAHAKDHNLEITTPISKVSNTKIVSGRLRPRAITRVSSRVAISRTSNQFGVHPFSNPPTGPLTVGWSTTGQASWYGGWFAGRLTANGQRFNPRSLTAAHKTLPLGTRLLVTSLETGRSAIVTVNDRGPYWHERILDLSEHAAEVICGSSERSHRQGVMQVRITILYLPPVKSYR